MRINFKNVIIISIILLFTYLCGDVISFNDIIIKEDLKNSDLVYNKDLNSVGETIKLGYGDLSSSSLNGELSNVLYCIDKNHPLNGETDKYIVAGGLNLYIKDGELFYNSKVVYNNLKKGYDIMNQGGSIISTDTKKKMIKLKYILAHNNSEYKYGYSVDGKARNTTVRQNVLWGNWNGIVDYKSENAGSSKGLVGLFYKNVYYLIRDWNEYQQHMGNKNVVSHIYLLDSNNTNNGNDDVYIDGSYNNFNNEAETYSTVLSNNLVETEASYNIKNIKSKDGKLYFDITYSGIITGIYTESGSKYRQQIYVDGKLKDISELDVGNNTTVTIGIDNITERDRVKVQIASTKCKFQMFHLKNKCLYNSNNEKVQIDGWENSYSDKRFGQDLIKYVGDTYEDLTAWINNPVKEGNLNIKKVDYNDNGPIRNMQFILTQDCTADGWRNESKRLVGSTDKNGELKFSDLTVGEYYLWENNTSNTLYYSEPLWLGIVKVDENSVTIIGKNSDKAKVEANGITITVKNKKITGGVTIEKIDKYNNNKKISDVWFGITTDSSAKVNMTNYKSIFGNKRDVTHSSGQVVFSDLKIGTTYYIWERNENEEYKKVDSLDNNWTYVGYVEISNAGNKNTIVLDNSNIEIVDGYKVTNTKTHGKIKLTKYDYDDRQKGINTTIEGITFDFVNKSTNKKYTYWTDENGVIETAWLPLGKYTVRETNNTDRENKKTGTNIGYSRNIGKEFEVEITEKQNSLSYSWDNRIYGGLEFNKTGVNDVKLNGVKFALYNLDGTKTSYTATSNNGSVSFANEETEYGVSIGGEAAKYSIRPGTYELYETENENEGYNLKYQGKYYVNGKGAYIGNVTITGSKITRVTTDKIELNKAAHNEKYASVYIYKYVEDYNNEKLTRTIVSDKESASFKLYNSKMEEVKLRIAAEGTKQYKNEKNVFKTEKTASGQFTKVSIERIPEGTYYLYESETPGSVSAQIQPGYDKDKKQVKIAKIVVDKNGKPTVEMVEDNARISGFKYRSVDITDASGGKEAKVNIFLTNRKYMKISGKAWEDVPSSGKTNEALGDGIYDTTKAKDKLLENVEVRLRRVDQNGTPIETVTTSSNGQYKFETLLNAKDVYDGKYYIVMDYSNINTMAKTVQEAISSPTKYLYVPVTPDFTNANGSKMVTDSILPDNDSELLQDLNKNNYEEYLKAQTAYGNTVDKETKKVKWAQNRNTLSKVIDMMSDGDSKHSDVKNWLYADGRDGNEGVVTLHNINLGIRAVHKTSYTLSQSLENAKIKINGYEYTYTYGSSGQDTVESKNAPAVKWASITKDEEKNNVSVKGYSLPIHYSDIKELAKEENSLSVTYTVGITNDENTEVSGYYVENNLVIPEGALKVVFNPNIESAVSSDIWNGQTNAGELSFVTNKNKIKIAKGKTETLNITFMVRKNVFEDMLNTDIDFTTEFQKKAVMAVQAEGVYHEYYRYDYCWKLPDGSTMKEENGSTYYEKDKVIYKDKYRYYAVEGNKQGKLHNSIPKTKEAYAPFLGITQAEKDRTISGYVFADQNVKTNNEVVGNGIYDQASEGKVEGVRVDLLKSLNPTDYATLRIKENKEIIDYTTNDEGKTIFSAEDGSYSIKGIIPGEYYIMFTYGDGTQKIYNTDGTEAKVYSNEYKSTIIPSENALKIKGLFNISEVNVQQKSLKDYINLTNNANMAVDTAINSESFATEKEVDLLPNNDGDSIAVTASTPKLSVPIEFKTTTIGDYKDTVPEFSYMNFGIIKKPEIKLKVDKFITNVRLTLQNGQVLFDGNPATSNIPYLVNLDAIWNNQGSKYSKVELHNEYLYGSELYIEYSIKVLNNSNITYSEENYYKYGETEDKDGNKYEKTTVNIKEILQYLDPDLTVDSIERLYAENKISAGDRLYNGRKMLVDAESEESIQKDIENNYNNVEVIDVTKNADGTDRNDYKLTTMVGSLTFKAYARKILSAENKDEEFTSYAQAARVGYAENTYMNPVGAIDVEQRKININSPSAEITVTPSTGEDKETKIKLAIYSAIVLTLVGINLYVFFGPRKRK